MCGVGFSPFTQISHFVKYEDRECLREKDHEDFHLVYDTREKKYYCWKPDLRCEDCDEHDWRCDIYQPVPEEIAKTLISQPILVFHIDS